MSTKVWAIQTIIAQKFIARFLVPIFFVTIIAVAIPNIVTAATVLGDISTTVPFPYQGYKTGSGVCWKMVGEVAGSNWTVNGSTAATGFLAFNGGNLSIPVVTSNVNITPSTGSTTQYIQFAIFNSAFDHTCSDTDLPYTNYLMVVDPSISITPSTNVPLSPPNSTSTASVTATLVPAHNISIQANCTGTGGATFPTGAVITKTTTNGSATFSITGANLAFPYPQGALSAYCKFTPYVAAGGSSPASVTLSFLTQVLAPTITINPTVVIVDGPTTIVASMSAPVWNGIRMNGSCTSSLPEGISVSLLSNSATTNNSGQATFTVNAANLVFVDANTTTQPPTATCEFNWPTGTQQAIAQITTANACNPSFGLVPRPPLCGNP